MKKLTELTGLCRCYLCMDIVLVGKGSRMKPEEILCVNCYKK